MIRCYVTNRQETDILATARRAVADGVDMIQVRERDLEARPLLELVREIVGIARDGETLVLVNDRLDVALAAGADGVHLPSNGLPVSEVRPHVRVLGVSTHSLDEAQRAEEAGADFVVFGPVFESPGKTPVSLEPLRELTAKIKIPVLGIGGITPANAREVVEAGAGGIAAIRMFQTGCDRLA